MRLTLRATGLLLVFFAWTALAVIFGAAIFPRMVPNAAESLQRTISLALRSVAALWALHGAAGGHEVGELMAAARQMGLPPRAVSLLFLAYRHVFVYLERIARVRMAVAMRSAGRRVSPKVAGRIAAALVIRASEQADKMALAMVARGFAGQLPTREIKRPSMSEVIAGAGGVALAGLLCWAVAVGL